MVFEITLISPLLGDTLRLFKRSLLAVFIVSTFAVAITLPIRGDQKPPSNNNWVESTLSSMTLDEKIGQLIIPATVGMFLTQDSDAFRQAKRDITEFHVGGYHMLGEENKLHEPAGAALF